MTIDDLKRVIHYDPESGVFTWLLPRGNGMKHGTIAGSYGPRGYKQIMVGKKNYRAHRLAWFYMTGKWPEAQIDHRNGIRDDNRFENLREASPTENSQNYALPSHNKSGYMGVHYRTKERKWYAQIKLNRKIARLGTFDTAEEASAAYLKAKAECHKFQPVPRDLKEPK